MTFLLGQQVYVVRAGVCQMGTVLTRTEETPTDGVHVAIAGKGYHPRSVAVFPTLEAAILSGMCKRLQLGRQSFMIRGGV
jgi:hypothetical protein